MPPFGCCTFLTFELDDDKPGRDHGAGQLRQRRPAADARTPERQRPEPMRLSLRILRCRFVSCSLIAVFLRGLADHLELAPAAAPSAVDIRAGPHRARRSRAAGR